MSDAKQVLKTILGSKKISYDVSMAAALGSPIAAILFSQACFYQFNSMYQELTKIEGLECFTKTTADWVEATGLTDDMVTSARKILTSCGIFKEAKMGLPSKIYTHVDIDAIVSVLNNYKETGGKVVKKEGLKNRESVKDDAGKFAKKPKFPILSEPCLPAPKFPILSEPLMSENRKLVPYFIGNKYKYNTLIFSYNKESLYESLERENETQISTDHPTAPPSESSNKETTTDQHKNLVPKKWIEITSKMQPRKDQINWQFKIQTPQEMIDALLEAGNDILFKEGVLKNCEMKRDEPLFPLFTDFLESWACNGADAQRYASTKKFRDHLRNFCRTRKQAKLKTMQTTPVRAESYMPVYGI